MSDALTSSIIRLGFDLFSLKLYWVACSTLWVYDYFLTLDDEVQWAWKGAKTPVFWLFILNRYLAPCMVIITLVAYFADAFTPEVCSRYGFMEGLATIILTSTAEIFIALRVYAITKKSTILSCFAGLIIACQWAVGLYVLARSRPRDNELAFLLSRDLPPLPSLPKLDPYQVCIFLTPLSAVPFVEAFLCLALAFDGVAFLVILFTIFKASSSFRFMPIMRVIWRDGIIYFLVLFSSNLVWLVLLHHARPGLKFMHSQPTMIISAIMINRVTLNLKKANQSHQARIGWGVATFAPVSELACCPNLEHSWSDDS